MIFSLRLKTAGFKEGTDCLDENRNFGEKYGRHGCIG